MNRAYTILQQASFRAFITSRFVLTVALRMQATAVAWQIFKLTHDPLSLGLVGLAEVVPAVGFAMIGGFCVDHYRRKPIVLAALLLQFFASCSLFFVSHSTFDFSTNTVVYGIYAAIFLSGIARAFLAAGFFALFGEIVPRAELVRGSAWNTTAWQIAASLGPALGGLIYGYVDVEMVYLLTVILIGLAVFSISFIPSRPLILETTGTKEPFLRSLTVGLRFVFQNKIVLSALCLDLFAVLFGGAVALFPIFADLLEVGPQGLGWMRAAPTIGAFFMALLLTHRLPNKNSGKLLLASVGIFGACMILFAISRSFVFTIVILGLSGAFDAVSVMLRAAILQVTTPSQMRGRVSAVNSIFISSSNELGAFESGVTARWFGAVPSVIVGGSLTLLVVGVIAFLSKPLRNLHLEDLKDA